MQKKRKENKLHEDENDDIIYLNDLCINNLNDLNVFILPRFLILGGVEAAAFGLRQSAECHSG